MSEGINLSTPQDLLEAIYTELQYQSKLLKEQGLILNQILKYKRLS